MNVFFTLIRHLFQLVLLGLVTISVAVALPNAGEELPAVSPQPQWGSGLTSLAPEILHSIVETKLRMAARTAYLHSEALAYGATVSAAAQADRDTAAGLFSYLDSRNNYVEDLQLQDLTVLPVGMRKTLSEGNGSLELGILRANFFRDHAELTVFVRLRIPSPDPHSSIKERELFFGADKVSFSRDGGLLGDFDLILLGDFVQPLGNMTLRFKGGANRFQLPDKQNKPQTYATVSCNSLAGVGIAADVLFPRSMLVPINEADGSVIPTGQVTLSFGVDAPKFPNFLININPNRRTAFAVTGYERFGFVFGGLWLDLSDVANAPIPPSYAAQLTSDSPDSDVNKWRGVYIAELTILLPSEFKERGKTSLTTISAYNLLYDRNGVSGIVSTNGLSEKPLSASGWEMSLQHFELAFEKNKLIGGRFAGNLKLPIAPDDNIGYDAIIDRQANYALTLATVDQLNFKLWRAKAELAPSSRVTMAVVNGKFKPEAVLHGRMGIFTNMKGDAETKERARIGFDGVVFEELRLQTESPYISARYFGYEGDSKLGGFAVTVQKMGVEFKADNTVGLRFGLRVNLMKDRFGGETDFEIVGLLSKVNEIQKWDFQKININKICVKGTVSTFTLDGCVAFFEGQAPYGDGFGGQIAFSMSDPAPIKGGEIVAMFGANDTFRYWFVSGGVSLTSPIPIAGPLQINAMYLSAYHNMKALSETTSPQVFVPANLPFANTRYMPDESIHLGFKAVAGLQAIDENMFRGSAALEMAFSRSEGLNNIGFYGEGQLMGSFTALTGSNSRVNMLMSKYQKVSADLKNKAELTKQELDIKAKTDFDKLRDGNSAVSGRLALLYDRTNHTFHGDAEVFVNIGRRPLLISGTGPGGRAGWMVMHFYDKNDWYVHIGAPDPAKRIGLQIGFPGMAVRTTGYFMTGYGIPDIPAPPAQVTSMFRNWGAQADKFTRTNAEKESLTTGKGIAFGANMDLRWDIDLWVPYLRINALAGLDVMMKSPYTICKPNAQDWYARGQAYAFLQGEAGIKFFGRRPLISVATAALLDAGLPDPTWIQGQLALQLRLGRVFNKTVSFDLALNRDGICR